MKRLAFNVSALDVGVSLARLSSPSARLPLDRAADRRDMVRERCAPAATQLMPPLSAFLREAPPSRVEPEAGARNSSRSRRSLMEEYARQLKEAHGDRAIAEAARRAVEHERNKDKDEAKTWRHVEAALKAMQGPIAS
jgi:hypothetical protein